MRVRYEKVPDRISMFSVWVIGETNWLAGYVHEADGKWIARRRGDKADKSFGHGCSTRSEAAKLLLLNGGFAQAAAVAGLSEKEG